jgi:hypothetical protein
MYANQAWSELAGSFLNLSLEDMAGAQGHNNAAVKLSTRANTYVQEAFAGLRALQR